MKFLLPLFFALSLALRAPAQEPPRPAVRPPDAPHHDAGQGGRESVLGDTLDEYGRLVGKKVVMDVTVSPTTSLNLADLDGVAPQQKINLIERTLFLNGYALIDVDKDTLAVLGPGRNPRMFGVPLYSKPEEIPSGERVFSYLCRLEHGDAIEVVGLLQQFIPAGNVVNFTAASKTRIIIVTAPTSIMRVVLRVVAALDAAEGAGR